VQPGWEAKVVRHEQEVEMHNEVTREIIVGLMVDYDKLPLSIVSRNIMELLARRGYEPKILACNQLVDGRRI
jgi:hypothetical protein